MNVQQKIEKCLKSAPKPATPDGLLNRLQEDVAAREIKKRVTVIRRWFAPSGGAISPWRVAAAAVIAIVILLSVSYGAVKIVKIYTLRFDSRRVNEDGSVTVTRRVVTLSGDFADEEEAARVWQETRELKKAGKYERTFRREIERNGVKRRIYIYRYTLSNGRVVTFAESEPVENETE